MKVNAVILVYSRPIYSYVTLESLSRSDIVKSGDFHMGALIVDHPKFKAKSIRNMLGKYKFINCPIIEQKVCTTSGSYSTRLACMYGYLYSHALESDWFVFIENDVLFNPDWFERTLEVYDKAQKNYKVGVLGPFNNYFRGTVSGAYGDTYRGRNRLESQVWVISPTVLEKMLDYPLKVWAEHTVGVDKRVPKALFHDGYMSITSEQSHIAHIGYYGAHGFRVGCRTRNFQVNPKVADLLALSESSIDGYGNGVKFPEVP